MKKTVFLLMFICSTMWTVAQISDAIEIIADRSIGKTNGYKVFIPKSDVKKLEAGFKSWMKEYSIRVERDKKTKEFIAKNVIIPSMGEGKYTIYTTYAETTEGGYLTTIVSVGDVYVTGNTHPKQSAEWIRLLTKFANEQAAEIVKEELESQEKELQSTGKAFEKLKKDQSDYEKDIAECEARIIERKAQLEKNSSDQAKVQSQLTEQEAKVEKIKAELKLYIN